MLAIKTAFLCKEPKFINIDCLEVMKASNLTMRGNVSDSVKSKSSGFSLALNVPGIIMSQKMTAPGSEISDPSAKFYEGLEPGKIIRWGLNL